jgi:hypothetical protein
LNTVQDFEVEALRRLKTLLDPGSLVTVPTVHLYDATLRVVVMDDCGESSVSLKQYLLETPPSLSLAQKIGDGLGKFLRCLHDWNKSEPSVIEYFDGNKQARNISAMITYGVVIDILTGANLLPLLLDPPLSPSSPDTAAIKALADERTNEILNRKDVVTMGDFWPGNILLDLDPTSPDTIKHIYVVDWELVKPGLAGLDVGQFSAEIQSVAFFYPQSKAAAREVLTAFLSSYRHSGTEVDAEVARVAATHAGVHLATWTPRVGWGGAQETKEAVVEGIKLMLEGHHASEEWLLNSFVRPLVSQE